MLYFVFFLRPETNGACLQAMLNNFVNTIERTAANEQDVARVDLDHLLLRMLSATLRRNKHFGTFKQLQQSLLYTFTRHITRDGGIVSLARDLIYFINVNDTFFS